MMHEFICCEELPSHGLLAADLSPHTNTLLFGPLYVSLDPRHVKSSSLTLSCKSQATLLDVMTSGAIGSMAMAPLANLRGLGPALTAVAQGEAAGGNGGESTQQTSQSHALKQRIAVALNSPAVNIDTCLVRYYIYIYKYFNGSLLHNSKLNSSLDLDRAAAARGVWPRWATRRFAATVNTSVGIKQR
jgi:hypothetical protein